MLQTPKIGLKIYEATDFCNYLETYNNTMYLLDEKIGNIIKEISEGSSILPTEEIEKLKKDVEVLNTQMETVNADISNSNQSIWILENRLNALYEQVQNIDSSIDEKLDNESFEQFTETINQTIYDLQENVTTLQSKVETLEVKNVTIEKNISTAQDDISLNAKNISSIQKQVINGETCITRNFYSLTTGSQSKIFNDIPITNILISTFSIRNSENEEIIAVLIGNGSRKIAFADGSNFTLSFVQQNNIYYPKITYETETPFIGSITIAQ